MSGRLVAALVAVHGLFVTSTAAQIVQPEASLDVRFIDAANGLTLEQAIAQALAQEPSLRAVRSEVDTARGMRLQAGLRPNPSVSFEQRGEPSGTDNQTMVNVEWPLDLFRRAGRIAVADREMATAELSVADRERLLAADVRMRYGEVLTTVRELTLLEELLATARRQHALLRSRAEEGAAPPLERDLVDVELRRLEADRLLQLGRTEGAMFELKRLLGISPSTPLALRDTLEDVVNRESTVTPTPSGGTSAAEQRADVREAESRIALAEAKVDRAQRDGRLDVSLFGGYMRMDAGFPQLGLSSTGTPERVHGLFHYLAAGAMVKVPLFDRNQGEIAAIRAERARATAAHEAARLSAETEIATARARDERAHEAVRLYVGAARTLARQNLNVVGQSYELGRVTVFEVLAEQRRYLDVERAYTEALRAAYEARTALKRALGDAQ